MGVEQREVGRWIGSKPETRRSSIAERLEHERYEQTNSSSYAQGRGTTDVDRLWRQSGSHEPARRTSFTAMQVPREHLSRTGPPTGEPDAGDPHVRCGGR